MCTFWFAEKYGDFCGKIWKNREKIWNPHHPKAARNLKVYDSIGAKSSREELTEQHRQVNAKYKFHQLIDACQWIKPVTDKIRGCPDGNM